MIEELSDDLINHYRQVLVMHAIKPEAGACGVCGVPRCLDWLDAFDRLAAAGQVMTTSLMPWKPLRPRVQSQSQPNPERGRHESQC